MLIHFTWLEQELIVRSRYAVGTTTLAMLLTLPAFPAGPNGDHACDSPLSLEQSMYAAIKNVAPNTAFTLFTGDVVDHAIWETSQAQNTKDIQDAYGRMTGLGNIYGTIGNHEQSPLNDFQSKAVGSDAQWVYSLLSGIWSQWIGSAAATTEQDIGAYSSLVPNTKLRILSLNTNMYYKLNFWLYQAELESDPNGQLAWLISELSSAEAAGERVYIIGHMPLGASDALYDQSNGFDQVVNRFSNTIAAMFFGHTHKDEFQISYSNYAARSYSNAVAYSYVMPSLTPTDGMPVCKSLNQLLLSFRASVSVYLAIIVNWKTQLVHEGKKCRPHSLIYEANKYHSRHSAYTRSIQSHSLFWTPSHTSQT